MKKDYLLLLIAAILAAGVVTSCKKGQAEPAAQVVENAIDQRKFAKVHQFLSFSLNLPISEVKYEPQAREFSIADGKYKFSFTDVEKRYDLANIYKLNHEKATPLP